MRSNAIEFQQEFLRKLDPPGMPPHDLRLEKGAIVMLLCNLDVSAGLCNGTRPIVENFGRHTLGCRFACGERRGRYVLLPLIDNYTDKGLSFRCKRTQFPVRLAFSLSINKAQGQSFDRVPAIFSLVGERDHGRGLSNPSHFTRLAYFSVL
ncbi:hypothetical protein OESDEN_00985 [Oesophagostomum dentatum]|uniref:DNA helicase Pif1-like 2B domain-containing protein n=1 Tax=Oesophagostomum dentatum TaxID=61180 RepID=A0A0B1TNB5_OESDE|nr:hypothetical protein OESDEN_00985 [Oesophagostomum dentatum]